MTRMGADNKNKSQKDYSEIGKLLGNDCFIFFIRAIRVIRG